MCRGQDSLQTGGMFFLTMLSYIHCLRLFSEDMLKVLS